MPLTSDTLLGIPLVLTSKKSFSPIFTSGALNSSTSSGGMGLWKSLQSIVLLLKEASLWRDVLRQIKQIGIAWKDIKIIGALLAERLEKHEHAEYLRDLRVIL
jgi:hypothetical protein